MRPQGVYVVFQEGRATHIVRGYREARRLSPHRAYKRFPPRHQTEAEEYAAWFNYQQRASARETKG